ncbi:MAG: hypothetical protein C0398_05930 [Coprothermobacter sp.]|nr:hypothetical protein [Coprothermobacter sp.]
MRQITDDEYATIEESGLQIGHWLESEMTKRERKEFDALSHEEKIIAKVEYLERKREERKAKAQAYLAAHPTPEKWIAPDDPTARTEGSMNDVDACLAALREHWTVGKSR